MGRRLAKVNLIFAAGTALFSDGYANNVIGSVKTFLGRVYPGSISTHDSTVLTSLAFAGFVVGMLVFGYLSDKLGRKFGMMTAVGIVFLFSGLSAASSGANGSIRGLVAMLSACRFLIGIGLGAEYPCGSVAAAEQSEDPAISKRTQHMFFTLATNTMIDLGFVAGAFVPLVMFWIFGENHLRAAWRMSLGFGMIPALLVFLWRWGMENPTSWKKNSMAKVRIPYWLVIKRYWPTLLAISTTWFIYDFITYPFGLYSSTIVDTITGNSSSLSVVFGWAVVINLFYMPGTIVGAFVVDLLGPKWTMITGLMLQALIGFIMSGLYVRLSHHVAGFAVIYGIFLSFGELGPGNCLGLLASKTSSTAIRGQYYGVAAAVGKVGAFVGIWAFPPMINAFGGSNTPRGNSGPFWVGSGLAIFSALITLFFIKPLTHDGMAQEDIAFREYLEANGFDTSHMGLPGESTLVGSEDKKGGPDVDEKLADEKESV
ncbi:MFS Git1p-related glycerophosphoinositol and glycerophosphocholine permease [Vararia minispora EC-137]|uniref:MFS Git1p-related glycerophosphoinositol and glycerophosphocholine permease n=1 Tax=Vararia minispora EC-137 TaxID=1314806 RepID=A0ACB8QPI1_9AGAM|nr:MFS Git1p-related glycerophosphoinositol and glycerophosphocholine permease [Vararia minispora EC-137]